MAIYQVLDIVQSVLHESSHLILMAPLPGRYDQPPFLNKGAEAQGD